MKTLLAILAILSIVAAHAQTAKFNELTETGKFIEYITKSGDTLRVGDKLTIEKPSADSHFNYLTQGNQFVSVSLSGKEIEVSQLKAWGESRNGYKMYAGFKGYGIPVLIDYESAVANGEIINPKAKPTREQAIAKLKEAKDLMDLGLITPAKFDSLKVELSPLIMLAK